MSRSPVRHAKSIPPSRTISESRGKHFGCPAMAKSHPFHPSPAKDRSAATTLLCSWSSPSPVCRTFSIQSFAHHPPGLNRKILFKPGLSFIVTSYLLSAILKGSIYMVPLAMIVMAKLVGSISKSKEGIKTCNMVFYFFARFSRMECRKIFCLGLRFFSNSSAVTSV